MFESGADFFHSPWEAEGVHQLADQGVKINFRIFWWWGFYNGEIAWNTSVVDLYYNASLRGLLEEYFDSTFSYLDLDKIWAVTLGEEELGYAHRYFWTPDALQRYNETYNSETGFWLRDRYDLNRTEGLVLDEWLSEKTVWVYNHLYDYVKGKWPHLEVFQFIGPWPGAPPVWCGGIDISDLKADAYKRDLYYYEAYDSPFWLYEYIRQTKTPFPEKEYHFWLWGEEAWTEGGLAGGFEHIRRNAWVAYLAGIDAIGWFNWHYIHGNMLEREDTLGKRLFAYTNRLSKELAKLPTMKPSPQVLVIRDEMMSFQLGMTGELGLFNEWDIVNQRALVKKGMDLSQYKLIIVNEDRYLDEAVEKLNKYVKSGGNLVLLGGFGRGQRNFYDNATRTANFLIEEGVTQKEIWGEMYFNISVPNPLGLSLQYEHLSLNDCVLALEGDTLTESHHPIGEFYLIEGEKLTKIEDCPLVLYHNSSNPDEGSILYWGAQSSNSDPDAQYEDVVEVFIPELNYTRFLYRTVARAFAESFLQLNGSLATGGTENMIITQSEIKDGVILAGVSNYYPQLINIDYTLDLDQFGLPPGEYWVHSLDGNLTLGRFESQRNLLEVPLIVEAQGTRLLLISQQRPDPSYSVDIFPDIPTPEDVEDLWLPKLSISSDYGSVTGEGPYAQGSTASFSVSPTTVSGGSGVRHVFTGWDSSSPGGYTGSENPAEAVIDNDIAEVALWKTQYYLTMEDGVGGSVTSSGWFDAGSEVTISATPDSGFTFSSWIGSGSGSYSGSNSSHTVTLNGPITEKPEFLDIADPIADGGYDRTSKVGEIVVFNAMFSIDNVGIVNYEWDFGDGTTETFLTATHVYNEVGTYTVTLTVKDRAGNSAMDTVLITVEDITEPFVEKWGFPVWILYLIGFGIVVGMIIYLMVKYS